MDCNFDSVFIVARELRNDRRMKGGCWNVDEWSRHLNHLGMPNTVLAQSVGDADWLSCPYPALYQENRMSVSLYTPRQYVLRVSPQHHPIHAPKMSPNFGYSIIGIGMMSFFSDDVRITKRRSAAKFIMDCDVHSPTTVSRV